MSFEVNVKDRLNYHDRLLHEFSEDFDKMNTRLKKLEAAVAQGLAAGQTLGAGPKDKGPPLVSEEDEKKLFDLYGANLKHPSTRKSFPNHYATLGHRIPELTETQAVWAKMLPGKAYYPLVLASLLGCDESVARAWQYYLKAAGLMYRDDNKRGIRVEKT